MLNERNSKKCGVGFVKKKRLQGGKEIQVKIKTTHKQNYNFFS